MRWMSDRGTIHSVVASAAGFGIAAGSCNPGSYWQHRRGLLVGVWLLLRLDEHLWFGRVVLRNSSQQRRRSHQPSHHHSNINQHPDLSDCHRQDSRYSNQGLSSYHHQVLSRHHQAPSLCGPQDNRYSHQGLSVYHRLELNSHQQA